ncbi:hypothetical protein KA001_02575 [Patescibacteria group bacterium]|nr:hypothetical protein [Patescibacteria group bacterium]
MESSAFSKIKSSLERKHRLVVENFNSKHSNFVKAVGHKSAAFLSGVIISATPPVSSPVVSNSALVRSYDNKDVFTTNAIGTDYLNQKYSVMLDFLKNNPNKLQSDDEKFVERELSKKFNLNLVSSIDGKRLNDIWGYFGQEQHLYRWKGDNLTLHSDYLKYGIAPSTGAFGYFRNAEEEKYYIAAPMHLIPSWNTDWPVLKPFFKFRKVLVFNPTNQKAVVAVIGDNGPALWTGKQFGGSPELMNYLQMRDGKAKSKAIVLLIDEKDENIALGPVNNNVFGQLAFNTNFRAN